MLATGRSIGWGTSSYGVTEEEIRIVEEGVQPGALVISVFSVSLW